MAVESFLRVLGGEIPHVDTIVNDVKYHFLHLVVDRGGQLLAWSCDRLLDSLALHCRDDLDTP